MDDLAQSLQTWLTGLPPRLWLTLLIALLIPAIALYALAGREAYRWLKGRIDEPQPLPEDGDALRVELAAANDQIQQLIAANDEMQAQLDAVVASASDASARIDDLIAENAALKAAASQRSQPPSGATEEVRRLRAQLAQAEADNKRLERELSDARTATSSGDASAELKQAHDQIARLTAEKRALQDELDRRDAGRP